MLSIMQFHGESIGTAYRKIFKQDLIFYLPVDNLYYGLCSINSNQMINGLKRILGKRIHASASSALLIELTKQPISPQAYTR